MVNKSKGSKKRSTAAFAVAPATEFRPFRRFVYGVDYVNEVVAQITPDTEDGTTTVTPDVRYVLQDANYNVVGIARDCDGTLIRQFRYTPYGELEAVEDGAGIPLAPGTSVDAWHLFQGMFYNPETRDPNTDPEHFGGQYSVDPRIYVPPLGRYLQRDPNGMALVLTPGLRYQGDTVDVAADFALDGQYYDGMNPYQFVGSDPVDRTDPAGLMFRDSISGLEFPYDDFC